MQRADHAKPARDDVGLPLEFTLFTPTYRAGGVLGGGGLRWGGLIPAAVGSAAVEGVAPLKRPGRAWNATAILSGLRHALSRRADPENFSVRSVKFFDMRRRRMKGQVFNLKPPFLRLHSAGSRGRPTVPGLRKSPIW